MHHGKRVRFILSARLPLAIAALPDLNGPGSGTLVFGAPDRLDEALPGPLTIICGFRPDHDRLTVQDHQVTPVIAPDRQPAQSAAACVIVCAARNRLQTLGRLAQALTALAPGGTLIVDGQKTDGIEAVLKALRGAIPLAGIASKSHGKIAWVTRGDTLPVVVGDWAKGARTRTTRDGWQVAPGMFSAEGLDPGTQELIAHLPTEAKGAVADLGAGWGALSRALLAKAPGVETCDLIEADHASLEAARSNVTDPRARFHWADALVFSSQYRLIVSNPPFHTGRAADPELGRGFIAAAARLLHPKGRLLMVANRQLPYEQTLEAAFHSWRYLSINARFKIIEAHHPRRARRGS